MMCVFVCVARLSFCPAPFFVLDEVDAALDNTNIGKVKIQNSLFDFIFLFLVNLVVLSN